MQDILDQAERYRQHTLYLGGGHYTAGKRTARRHNLLGLPVVIMTSVVGTSIFATLSSTPTTTWKILTGLVSLSATVLAAVQTFFRFSEQAEKHKAAGANYGTLRRQFDVFLLRYAQDDSSPRNQALLELQALAERLGQLAKDSPDLSDRLYDDAMRRVGPPPTPSLAPATRPDSPPN